MKKIIICLVLISLLMLSGCTDGFIDNLAGKLTDNSKTNRMYQQLDMVEECRIICFEEYGVKIEDIAWDTEHEFGGSADICYDNCYKFLS